MNALPGRTLLIEPVQAGMGPLGPVIEVRMADHDSEGSVNPFV